ncbi:hypothetical protein GCM10010471_19270 [Leucobacter komagatae]
MAVLSTIRLITGAINAPMGSQLRYSLFGLLGVLIGIFVTIAVVAIFWSAGYRRVQHILAEDPSAPVAVLGGLAEDGNEVLTNLGASHSFPKPERVLISFGATAEGLHVYRRFGQRIALLPANRIDNIWLERRALATGREYEVMTFTIRHETGESRRLSLAMFSPGKLCMIPYSPKYMQNILAEFRETLGVKDRAA